MRRPAVDDNRPAQSCSLRAQRFEGAIRQQRDGFIASGRSLLTRQADADARSPEVRNLLGPFKDYAGIVF